MLISPPIFLYVIFIKSAYISAHYLHMKLTCTYIYALLTIEHYWLSANINNNNALVVSKCKDNTY